MATYRKVSITGIEKVSMNKRALMKLIRYYYKGSNDIEINFDNRATADGQHVYHSSLKKHVITLSPKRCSHEQKAYQTLDFENNHAHYELYKLNEHDASCKIIQTILHELKHAMQCDSNPIRYAKCADDRHPDIDNLFLKYKYSELEAEAEGWSLLHLNRAITRYKRWLDESNAGSSE